MRSWRVDYVVRGMVDDRERAWQAYDVVRAPDPEGAERVARERHAVQWRERHPEGPPATLEWVRVNGRALSDAVDEGGGWLPALLGLGLAVLALACIVVAPVRHVASLALTATSYYGVVILALLIVGGAFLLVGGLVTWWLDYRRYGPDV